MMTGLALLGLLAFLASQSGKGSATGGPDPAVTADLQKLYAANVTAYNAVVQLLGGGNPALMMQYAMQLNALYPALAQQLATMAQAQVTPVTGASGTTWNLWGKESDGVSNIDVLLEAQPILSYQQTGHDKSTRHLLGQSPNVDSAVMARARADFGV